MSHPLKLSVHAVRVLDESNETSASDEPYVIVFVADVSSPFPNAKTTSYVWTDADEGDVLRTVMNDEIPQGMKAFISGSQYCWGPNGKATPIDDPDDLVILAGILENDNGNPSQARSVVNGLMAGSLANMAGSKLTRAEKAARLKQDMAGALGQARMTGAPDFDDRVGPVKELRLRQADLDKAHSSSVFRKLEFNGGDADGAYRVAFELQRG